MFGGFAKRDDTTSEDFRAVTMETSDDLIAAYYKALQEYREAVKTDQANGLLPQGESSGSDASV